MVSYDFYGCFNVQRLVFTSGRRYDGARNEGFNDFYRRHVGLDVSGFGLAQSAVIVVFNIGRHGNGYGYFQQRLWQ